MKRCVICNKKIEEECGKLRGTILNVKNEKRKKQFIYVCNDCQKKDNWIETAKIKGV